MRTIATSVLALSALIGASSALAHEPRVVAGGALQISVGFRDEPAFEDQVNAVDVFVRRSDGTGVSGPDNVVALLVEVQLRTTDAFDAPSVASAELGAPRLAFGTTDRYNASFKPTADGAYAFRVRGRIHDVTGGAEPVEIDETFVCGGGAQDARGRAFGCVEDPIAFPSYRLEQKTGRDFSGYRDNDEFSRD